ncbi:MAG: hypothetical protein ACJAVH_000584, partial [Bacteroidia bacterium]
MKKLFLSLFVAGALTFTLQSCASDEVDACEGVTCATNETCVDGDCIPDAVATCDVCGIFDGSADGSIIIPLTGTDTTFTGVVVSASVTENATAASYNMAIDISSLLGAAPGTLVPDVDGTLAGQTITITNETYNYQGLANITIDGTVDYDATFVNIDGALDLTGDA